MKRDMYGMPIETDIEDVEEGNEEDNEGNSAYLQSKSTKM